jgi:hypothetical protein
VEGPDHTVGSSFIQIAGNDIELTGASINDQDFIASAKQDIPRLISVIANLKGWSCDFLRIDITCSIFKSSNQNNTVPI